MMADADVEALIADIDGTVRVIVDRLRVLVRRVLLDAVEEPDPSSRLIAYTYQPGTYKGLVVAIAPHTAHVNLMFAKGVELLDTDAGGLLEGTGRKARHIKLRDPDEVDRPGIAALVAEAPAAPRVPEGTCQPSVRASGHAST